MIKQEFFKRILSSVILIPLTLYILVKGSFIFNFFLLGCLLISVYEWLKLTNKLELKIAGTSFLIFSFLTIFKLRNEFNNDYFLILFVLIICISTDIGGYIFGKIFKGPKLTKISPNKTVSGAIGSFLLSLIITIFFFTIIQFNINFSSIFHLILIIILISFVSQLGDLTISYFKRESKIKDTGKIIPGHGGILDRIDGMIFAFPFFYLLISFNFLILF